MSGPVGTIVTISGSNFSTTATDNIVYFGSVKAQVLSAASGQLAVSVPVGATYDPITVAVNRHIAYSRLRFSITFPSTCNFTEYTFAPGKGFSLGATANESDYGDMVVGDIDGDGKNDIVSATWDGLVENSTPGVIIRYGYTVYFNHNHCNGAAIADVDGDGKPDVVVTNGNANLFHF